MKFRPERRTNRFITLDGTSRNANSFSVFEGESVKSVEEQYGTDSLEKLAESEPGVARAVRDLFRENLTMVSQRTSLISEIAKNSHIQNPEQLMRDIAEIVDLPTTTVYSRRANGFLQSASATIGVSLDNVVVQPDGENYRAFLKIGLEQEAEGYQLQTHIDQEGQEVLEALTAFQAAMPAYQERLARYHEPIDAATQAVQNINNELASLREQSRKAVNEKLNADTSIDLQRDVTKNKGISKSRANELDQLNKNQQEQTQYLRQAQAQLNSATDALVDFKTSLWSDSIDENPRDLVAALNHTTNLLTGEPSTETIDQVLDSSLTVRTEREKGRNYFSRIGAAGIHKLTTPLRGTRNQVRTALTTLAVVTIAYGAWVAASIPTDFEKAHNYANHAVNILSTVQSQESHILPEGLTVVINNVQSSLFISYLGTSMIDDDDNSGHDTFSVRELLGGDNVRYVAITRSFYQEPASARSSREDPGLKGDIALTTSGGSSISARRVDNGWYAIISLKNNLCST